MRFVVFLLAVLFAFFSTPAWAEEADKKPIPIPQDMSKAIKESPFAAPINHCNPNKPQNLEQDCAEDPLHKWRRLQEERISRENNTDPNDPCSKSLRNPLSDLYCFYKREADEMKITEQIESLKKQPEKYSQKRTECGCKETVPDETDPLWKWRESSCMRGCLRKDSK
ncbi:MAG: hypothetical protein KDI61_07900 [Alphaproteobacteria bacterium]|nr:hypothetical protein [Alphaproteobacteria bacterium]MCB1840167.1 hypothetical protein [Alphaproteobacteria bacterium]